jgi:hypothetical protein
MARNRAPSAQRPSWSEVWERLFAPVDIASLVAVRVALGLCIAWEAYFYLSEGSVYRRFLQGRHLIGWPGFEWVQTWPGDGMYLHFYAIILLGLCFSVGLLYRVVAPLLCASLVYVLLLSQASYLNHLYLMCLLTGVMACIPAHRDLSLDARLRPAIRRETAPSWCVWLLRVQVGLLYFYGGVAKINPDWLQGFPMRLWLPERASLPFLGELFESVWIAVAMSWSGLLIDLLAFPALVHRRTRPFAFLVLVSFHLWNSQLFTIAVFPFMAIAVTTIFFEPDWPRRLFRWPRRDELPEAPTGAGWTTRRRLTAAAVTAFAAVQVLLPLRHWLYPGNASWTGEGHHFAWRMMLRQMQGYVAYRLTDHETGESWIVNPHDELGTFQYRRLGKNPGMIHLYARHLAELAREEGHRVLTVNALALATMNERKPQPLIDPEVDLAGESDYFGHAWWILPVESPLGRAWIAEGDDRIGALDTGRPELE